MDKEKEIEYIKNRIESEHRKHAHSLPDEWMKICARKIYISHVEPKLIVKDDTPVEDFLDRLEEVGFVKKFNKSIIAKNSDKSIFVKKIYPGTFFEFDPNDGFVMLVRMHEHTKQVDKVIIPNKINNWGDFVQMHNTIAPDKI